MATTATNLPQLNSGNFNNWKFRVTAILEEKQLKIVFEKKLEDFPDIKDKENFQQKDSRAKSTIIQCITDKHLDLVKDAKTAKEMMKALEDVFERKSIFTKLTLKKKLLTLKIKEKTKLEDHFLTFDTIIRELENAGSKIEETDKVCHLLLTLNEEYDSVITAIETLNTDVTMDFVKARLLDEELKFKNKNAQKGTNNEETSFKAFPYACYRCGKEGHKISECNQSRQPNRGNYRSRRSYGANRRGSRFRRRGRGQDGEEKANQVEEEISFYALNCKSELNNKNCFILDSGATQNLVNSELEKYMTNIEHLKNEVNICVANGQKMSAKRKGILHGTCQGRKLNLNTLIVDGLTHNLISVSQLLKKGNEVLFKDNEAKIIGSNFEINCETLNNLFVVKINVEQTEYCKSTVSEESELWHRRLGHLNKQGLKLLELPVDKSKCSVCIEAKSTRNSFHTIEKRSKQIGDLIHSDLAGPINPPTFEGHRYFQVLIDDNSHFVVVKLLKTKNEAEENIIDFVKLIKTQHERKTKRIRIDNGKEFSSNFFKNWCKSKGIELQYTIPYSPQQNGTSERMNRTLMNKVRTKLVETGLPKELWGEAIRASAYELNRSPTSANNGIPPATRWCGRNDLQKLRVFGCQAWMVKMPKESKLEPRAEARIMVGYSGGGYRLWNSEDNTVTNSRDVTFEETKIKFNKIQNQNTEIQIWDEELENKDSETEQEKEEKEEEKKNHSQNENITRTGRNIKTPQYLDEYQLYEAYCMITEEENDPKNFKEAIKTKEWNQAIQKELKVHEKLNTWSRTKLPKNKAAIETKWVFRTKEDGTKKARIVAKGFQMQEESILNTIYAPVARISTIRVMLAQALQMDWSIKQLDIPAAFLNGKLESEVYVYPPEGMKIDKNQVLKLNRALYGLKEAPKVWNDRFNEFAIKKNLKRSHNDYCLYYNKSVWMIVYVDDLLITGEHKEVNEIIETLKQEFEAKYLGEVKHYLGMTINRSTNNIKITQTKLIEKILHRFKMDECTGISTPMESNFEAMPNDHIENVPFRQLIGSLMYLATTSRPDITFAVCYLSRMLDKPTQQIWKAGKRVLRYLKTTKNLGLNYQKGPTTLQAYSDANWGTDKIDRKSVSGSIIFYGENPVSWFTKKQSCVALSTAESEYIAAAATAQELINLKGILSDFNVNCDAVLKCDNNSAISMSKNSENSKRGKHIDIRHHFLKDLINSKVILIEYVSSSENIADTFTKPLSKETFVKFRNMAKVL